MSASDPLFFLIAGEASGDYLGAQLMRALKIETGRKVRFAGIGGPRMRIEGLDPLFPQTELAHMGFLELVRHLPNILRRMRQTIRVIEKLQPAALITIDSPDFCFRVARRIKGKGIPLIHYVAPSVWAWRPGRAKKIAAFLDHLLALLPFEPPYFEAVGLPCTFVGHPLVESAAGRGDGARFRRKHSIAENTPLVAVLPGSRMSEVKRLLPVFSQTIELLRMQYPELEAIIPVVPGVASLVEKEVKSWPLPVHLTKADADKYDGFAAARVGLACSGTVSVELALCAVPSVIAYRASAFSAALARRFVKTKYATLLNIMKDKDVMPEFIQEKCTPLNLCEAVGLLMTDEAARKAQLSVFDEIATWLGRGAFVPSEKAARTVLSVVRQKGTGA